MRRRLLTLALLAGAAHPAVAQEAPAGAAAAAQEEVATEDAADAELAEDEAEEILVTGSRMRGAVIGDIPPEISLNAREIQALGTANVAELLEALAPQTRSGRGRGGGGPVVLLNGNRISGFSEVRDLPPEAISRVDILPEEVALKYGYRADQRVVNIVLRQRFRAITTEAEYGFATAGGRGNYELDANLLRIMRDGRFSFDAEFEHQDPLFESERDLIQAESAFSLGGNVTGPGGGEIDPALSALAGEPVTIAAIPTGGVSLTDFAGTANAASVTDEGEFRTLLGASDTLSFNATLNRTIFETISATINGRFEASETESLLGLPSAELLVPAGNPFSPFAGDVTVDRLIDSYRPLTRSGQSQVGEVGLGLNGALSGWRWSFTGNYTRSGSETRTDRGFDLTGANARTAAGDPSFNPFASLGALPILPRDFTEATNESVSGDLVANGSPLLLPAGEVSTTFRLGASRLGIESLTSRAGIERGVSLGRTRFNGQANVDVPIADRDNDVLAAIGDLSLNANAEIEELSDFGTLLTLGYGINWSPLKQVRVIASVTEEDGAPSIQQLGDPLLVTPNVRVFDFVRGETIDISRITGGNPDLLADSRSALKIGVSVEPIEETDLRFSAEYNRSHTRDLIAAFPTATPEIEAAFPDRFVRDASGRLLSVDSRPVNFAEAKTEELRWGINFSKRLGPEPEGGFRGRREGRRGQGAGGEAGTPPAQPSAAPVPEGGQTPPPQEGERQRQREGAGGGAGSFFGGRGGGRFGGGPRGGRLQLSLYHTWRLTDEVLIRDGLPPLDFLDGSAVGSSGGRPAHQVELQTNVFKDGFGGRLSVDWQDTTFVSGSTPGTGAGGQDLFFSDRATVNLRLFANLAQQEWLVGRAPFFRGTRLTLGINNLFNGRPEVRDAAGETPIGYQPDYLDPLGRSVRISFRKLFF